MAGFPEHVRVFTAVDLAPSIRKKIHGEAQRLICGLGKVSAPPSGNLHVTLKFIGEVNRRDLPALSDAVARCAECLVAGHVEVSGFGAFPRPERPRVLWAGVSDPSGILTPVHDCLNRALTEFGAKHEKKRFVPHVTVARVRSTFDAEEFADRLEEAGQPAFGIQPVDEIALYMSEMARGKPPQYTLLGRYPSGLGY